MGVCHVVRCLSLVSLIFLTGVRSAPAEPPQVVVSIKPVHALVAHIMEGVGVPTLLIKGAGSPHSYSMRPSDARALANARIVFYVGASVETFLERPLKKLARKATVVAIGRRPGIIRLKTRSGGLWEGHGVDGESAQKSGAEDDDGPRRADKAHDDRGNKKAGKTEGHDHHLHGSYDGHIWLDPRNAVHIVEIAVATLSNADAANSATYAKNGRAAIRSIRALDAEIARQLAPVNRRPFIVLHDAYQYFEARYGLNAAGSITVSPDRPPGAKRLYEIRRRILKHQVRCVFAEPQFQNSLVRTVTEGTPAKAAVLDSLGASIPSGKAAYSAMMRALADAFADCLGRSG